METTPPNRSGTLKKRLRNTASGTTFIVFYFGISHTSNRLGSRHCHPSYRVDIPFVWSIHSIFAYTKQAAGMVTIAHRSGGPAADIVAPLPDGRVTGFLAETPEEYAAAMAQVFRQDGSCVTMAGGDGSGGIGTELADAFDSSAVRVAGRESARRFSNTEFDARFSAEFAGLLQSSRSPGPTRHRD